MTDDHKEGNLGEEIVNKDDIQPKTSEELISQVFSENSDTQNRSQNEVFEEETVIPDFEEADNNIAEKSKVDYSLEDKEEPIQIIKPQEPVATNNVQTQNQPLQVAPENVNYQKRRQKLPVGTKVFLWVLSVICVGGFVVAGIKIADSFRKIDSPNFWNGLYNSFSRKHSYDYDDDNYNYDFDDKKDKDDFDDDNDKYHDFNGGNDDAPDYYDKPDIDITPNTEGIAIDKKPDTEELSAADVYARVVQSTVMVEASVYVEEYGQSEPGTGTGIIATSDGYIITNSHVVMNTKSADVKIITHTGEEYDAIVVGFDKTTDVAILKTNDHNFTPAEFGDADDLLMGEWVIAIGNPGGAQFSSSLTRGVISGLNRNVGEYSENGMTYIQTDAAINPGNSGGPLVNMHGQVVGINSSKIVSEGYEGMGFAIPISKAKGIIDQLFEGGYVKGRTRLGIRGKNVESSGFFFSNEIEGFEIETIDEASAFSNTEAKVGDIITKIAGENVDSVSAIGNILLKYKPGDEVEVTLYRKSTEKTFTVTITLLEDKGETQR